MIMHPYRSPKRYRTILDQTEPLSYIDESIFDETGEDDNASLLVNVSSGALSDDSPVHVEIDTVKKAKRTEGSDIILAEDIGKHDVLSERGGKSNNFIGNKRYRGIIMKEKWEYHRSESKERKSQICESVIGQIHSKGGRFLMKHPSEDNSYTEMPKWRTRTKVAQALREKKELKMTADDKGGRQPPKKSAPVPTPAKSSSVYMKPSRRTKSSVAETVRSEEEFRTAQDDKGGRRPRRNTAPEPARSPVIMKAMVRAPRRSSLPHGDHHWASPVHSNYEYGRSYTAFIPPPPPPRQLPPLPTRRPDPAEPDSAEYDWNSYAYTDTGNSVPTYNQMQGL